MKPPILIAISSSLLQAIYRRLFFFWRRLRHQSTPSTYSEEDMSPDPSGAGAGLVAADFDSDGFVDLFYAHSFEPLTILG